MAIHKKYFEDGVCKTFIETKSILQDGIRIVIFYQANFSNDGFLELSVEKEKYYSLGKLCKEIETEKDAQKESQKILYYYENGELKERTFLESNPFQYSEESTIYGEDGKLKERKTVKMETNPVDLERKEKDNTRIQPMGFILSQTIRRNFYENEHMIIRYGLDAVDNTQREVYSEFDQEGTVLFIEKKEINRHVVSEDNVIENIKIENTNGLLEESVIYEERKGEQTERLCLETEEVEERHCSDYSVFLTVRKHNDLKRSLERHLFWEDDTKHIETKEKIYNTDGIPFILRKKYKKIFFDETGVITMISEKEGMEKENTVKQIRSNKEFGKYIGEYMEEITTLEFKEGKLISCQIESYFDPEHLMGMIETTKENPWDVDDWKHLHTVRKTVSFGNASEENEIIHPFWEHFIDPKRKHLFIDRKHPRDFLGDISRNIQQFILEDRHEWMIERELEMLEDEMLEEPFEAEEVDIQVPEKIEVEA